jgi:hypothetical protein
MALVGWGYWIGVWAKSGLALVRVERVGVGWRHGYTIEASIHQKFSFAGCVPSALPCCHVGKV